MSRKGAIFGAILIVLGLILIANTLDIIWFDFEDVLRVMLPLTLIGIGIWLIVRKSRRSSGRAHYITVTAETSDSFSQVHTGPPPPPPPPGATRKDDTGFVDDTGKSGEGPDQQDYRATESPSHSQPGKVRYSKTLGDMYIDFKGVPMQNVEVSMGVGDLEARLTGCDLAKGLNRLVISGFIGDIRLFVPKDLPCQAHCSNSIGDIDLAGRYASGFGNNVECHTPAYETAETKLYIAVNSFIGDIKIYST